MRARRLEGPVAPSAVRIRARKLLRWLRRRPAQDGFAHPTSETELIELVKQAYSEGRQLRVRGAAHSPAHAIYTDPPAGFPNQVNQETPPAGDGINVMLDGYTQWCVRDRSQKLIEAQAGIHLGP